MRKLKYAVDSNNKLLIKKPGSSAQIAPDGAFETSKNNRLIYWLNEPSAWRKKYALPSRIDFEGNWRLNANSDLELILRQTKNQYEGDHLTLKGEIVSGDRDTLAFEVNSHDKRGCAHLRLLKLAGSWQADEHNRIIFLVDKKTSPDRLTLESAWRINENQQIIYVYEKTELKTKTKSINTLTFSGYWKLSADDRLCYMLTHSQKSSFDFRVQIETPNLYPKEGVIKYRLGIGSRKEKKFKQEIISLFGEWKLAKKLGLSFVMDYGSGRIKSLEFSTQVYLTKNNNLVLTLMDKKNKPIGLYITLTHDFLQRSPAEAFLRFKNIQREQGIETGLRIPF